MTLLRAIASRFERRLFLAAVFLAVSAPAQDGAATATLYGTIRDAQGKAIASVTVRLQNDGGTDAVTARTDDRGKYSFSSLPSGTYSVKAEISGYATSTIPSIRLEGKQTRVLDLTLEPVKNNTASATAPQFFDPPQFTVSGVTDTTSQGGHGSDVVVRTTDTLAKQTVALGKPQPKTESREAEKSLREDVARAPGSFAANHALGKTLMDQGHYRDAIPYLLHASQLTPTDDENTFDLSLAYLNAGDYGSAREEAESLLVHDDSPRTHHLLADIEEKSGNSLDAVREYQRAAELDPTEPNLFDWASELLLHHAPEPAAQIFNRGIRLFPGSVRLHLGLAAAQFATGSPDQAIAQISQASDLEPGNPAPYLFLGKMLPADNTPSDQALEKLQRFVSLHPDSADANYYYALALWKKSANAPDAAMGSQIESLLNQALRLDPNFGAAYLQLGILHSAQKNGPRAIADFQHAVQAVPSLAEAHYRLSQAYRANGDLDKAKVEALQYQQLARKVAESTEREHHEIRQFVYTLRDHPADTGR